MNIPVNRHYYSLVTEKVDSRAYVPNKNSGEGQGSLRVLVVLRGGGGRPSRPNRLKSASWSLGGRRPEIYRRYVTFLPFSHCAKFSQAKKLYRMTINNIL